MSGAMDGYNTITLSPEALLEIEEALNEPRFFGVPAGATLNEAMIVALYNAKRVWSRRARATDYLRYCYQRYRQPASGTRDLSRYNGRIVFTWLFDRPDLKALIFPLVERYGDDALVVGPSASMRAQLPSHAQFVSWDEFPGIDMDVWRREFDRCSPIWGRRLNEVLARHSIPSFIARFLLCRLQVQTQRLMASSQFVDAVGPLAIVTEYDRGGISSCLVLVARQRGIPAVTLIHGAGLESYPSYGFAPILSTYACCWGSAHRHNLLEHGVDPDRLIVTGCQSMSRTLAVQQEVARLKIGLPADRPTVLLATNPIKLEDRKKYAMAFCGAMRRLPEVSAFVRLHPAESLAEYKELIKGFPRVKFLSNEAMSRDESLAAADVVVNHESSFGIDALLKGKLVVVLDVLGAPLKVAKDLVELANSPLAKSSEELERVIREVLSNDEWRNELQVGAEQYALQYCHSYGQDAVDNVCRVIDRAIEQREPQAA